MNKTPRTSDLVRALDVGTLPRQGHLDARWPPRDEVHELSLSDSLQCFVDLKGRRRGEGGGDMIRGVEICCLGHKVRVWCNGSMQSIKSP
jgi:hypothetical protein